jgi:hypothetical protein
MDRMFSTATPVARTPRARPASAQAVPCAIVLALLLCPWNGRTAFAGTSMAEPVIEENITDIDGTTVGTIEMDATGTFLHARAQPGGGLWDSGIEAEWRAIDRLGLGLELSATGSVSGSYGAVTYRPRGAISWVLMRDLTRRLFLQAEATARYEAGTEPALIDVTEPALPYTLGLRAAGAWGPLVLRAGLIGEAGRAPAHAPLRTSAAALITLSREGLQATLGLEGILDLARDEPVVLAPEIGVLFVVAGRVPVRIGLSVPVTMGGSSNSSSLGLVLRIVLEPSD